MRKNTYKIGQYTFVVQSFDGENLVAIDSKGRTVSINNGVYTGLAGKPCVKHPEYLIKLVEELQYQNMYDELDETQFRLADKLSDVLVEKCIPQLIEFIQTLDNNTYQAVDSLASILLNCDCRVSNKNVLISFYKMITNDLYPFINMRSFSKACQLRQQRKENLYNYDVYCKYMAYVELRPLVPAASLNDDDLMDLCEQIVNVMGYYGQEQPILSDVEFPPMEFWASAIRNHTLDYLANYSQFSRNIEYLDLSNFNTIKALTYYYRYCKFLNRKCSLNNIASNLYEVKAAFYEKKHAEEAKRLLEWQTQQCTQFEANGWSLIIPTTRDEFIKWGDIMHNCFGWYAYDHAIAQEGVYCIAVNSETGTPQVAIEVKPNGKIGQYYRSHNRPADDDAAKAFRKAYAEFLEGLDW